MKVVKYSVALLMTKVEKFLFSLFLTVCVVVHIVGLIQPYTAEPSWSHVIHIVSYTSCLLALLVDFKHRTWVYVIGLLYPFYYHSVCLSQFADAMSIVICGLVVVLLPLMWWRMK